MDVSRSPLRGGLLVVLALVAACERPAAPPEHEPLSAPFWNTDDPDRPGRAHPAALEALPPDDQAVVKLSPEEERALASPGQRPAAPARAAAGAPRPAALVTPTRIVTGLHSETAYQENATTLVPRDLTGEKILAHVPNSVTGGFDVYPGNGNADGTFSIPGVPVGNCWLSIGLEHVWTASDHVEWVYETYGRTDVVVPGITPTNLVVSASDLAAWNTTDELVWASPNHGMLLSLRGWSAAGDPAPGATALSGYTLDFSTLGLPLLDAARGDQGYLTQLTTRGTGASAYRALGKVLYLPALTMADGGSTAVNGGFLDVAQTSSLRVNWRRSQLGELTPLVNPAAVLTLAELGLWTTPLGLARGVPSTAFQLLTYDSAGSAAATDVDLGDVAYGNPFPSTWPLLAETYAAFSVSFLAPGATVPAAVRRSAYTATQTLPTATAPLAPQLGPVRNARVNGKDLFLNQLGVGTSPTLSWDAPSLGLPTNYVVRIMQIFNASGRTRFATRALFFTQVRNITLPPGILQPGSTYVAVISAQRNLGVNPAEYPFRSTLPFSSAPMISSIFAP